MTSEYIKEIDSSTLYKSGENDIGFVSLFDVSRGNECEGARIEVVSKIAAASFGHDESKSPPALYKKLLKERNTCLEFIRMGPDFDIKSSLRNDPTQWYSQIGEIEDHKENVVCVKLRAPLMVIAHLVRHRSFSYNQNSRRYMTIQENEIFMPDDIMETIFGTQFKNHIKESIELYREMLKAGIKKEVARGVLPAYLLMSDMWMIGNKEAWQSLFKIRLSDNEKVQNFTKNIVQAIKNLVEKNQPKVLE